MNPVPFQRLYGLDDAQLIKHGARRYAAEEGSTLPDRVELRHARPGEHVLLVNYVHQPAATPYRASHAVYVLEGATRAADLLDVIPEPLCVRLLSLRVFDADDMMIDAAIVSGNEAEQAVRQFLSDSKAAYIHAHYAARGCYAARIDRA